MGFLMDSCKNEKLLSVENQKFIELSKSINLLLI